MEGGGAEKGIERDGVVERDGGDGGGGRLTDTERHRKRQTVRQTQTQRDIERNSVSQKHRQANKG